MATMYFRGRIDFDLLSMAEISEITAAMSILEKLGEKEGFEFEAGRSRRSVPRPDFEGPRSSQRALTQRRVLVTLHNRGPMIFDDLMEACGLKSGSITPNLSALFKEGLLVKSREMTGRKGRARNKDTIYSLNEGGMAIAAEIIADGQTPTL
nr:MarR family transcriptional regulator [Neorhizobium tomejilense]